MNELLIYKLEMLIASNPNELFVHLTVSPGQFIIAETV